MEFECKKYHCKCEARCCGIVPIEAPIWSRNQHHIKRKPTETHKVYATTAEGNRYSAILPVTEDGYCPFLGEDLSCAIYEDRPDVCKRFGDESHWALKCPMQHADGSPRSAESQIEITSKAKEWLEQRNNQQD